jgi:hypothetical protein
MLANNGAAVCTLLKAAPELRRSKLTPVAPELQRFTLTCSRGERISIAVLLLPTAITVYDNK